MVGAASGVPVLGAAGKGLDAEGEKGTYQFGVFGVLEARFGVRSDEALQRQLLLCQIIPAFPCPGLFPRGVND